MITFLIRTNRAYVIIADIATNPAKLQVGTQSDEGGAKGFQG